MLHSSRGSRDKHQSRAVLEAALRVFWECGFACTSLDDLTAATGVARPGLYRVFGNKEAFFARVLSHYQATRLGFVARALGEASVARAIDALLHGVVALVTDAAAPPGCLQVSVGIAGAADSEPVRHILTWQRDVFRSALRARIEQASRAGEFPADLDARRMTDFLITVMQGLAVGAQAQASREELEAVVAHVMLGLPRMVSR